MCSVKWNCDVHDGNTETTKRNWNGPNCGLCDNDTRIQVWNSKGHNCTVCGSGGNDSDTRTLG